MRSDNLFAGSPASNEFVHLGGCSVENGHGIAVTFHVQDQVFTHDRQTDQTNICSGLHRQTKDLSQFGVAFSPDDS